MKAQILTLACLSVLVASAVRGEEEFAFRARGTAKAHKTSKAEKSEKGAAAPVQDPYLARKGDTLWDVAGRFWDSPKAWPELWALNPHLRNPHRVDPGDPIFLSRKGQGEEIHLPLARIDGGAPTADTGKAGAKGQEAGGEGKPARAPIAIRTTRGQSGHFVSSHRISGLGVVRAGPTPKNLYTMGDDVVFGLKGGAQLKPGDLVTVFDDSSPVTHPVHKTPQGYLVRVLGHVQVRSVTGSEATGEIVEAFDSISEGSGIMPYRKPVARVVPQAAKPDVDGFVLSGMPEQLLFGLEDLVFLDRGSIHGLEQGAVLEVPVPAKDAYFAGLIDLEKPIARILVLSVEDKTATGLILASRVAVLPGARFVASALSP